MVGVGSYLPRPSTSGRAGESGRLVRLAASSWAGAIPTGPWPPGVASGAVDGGGRINGNFFDQGPTWSLLPVFRLVNAEAKVAPAVPIGRRCGGRWPAPLGDRVRCARNAAVHLGGFPVYLQNGERPACSRGSCAGVGCTGRTPQAACPWSL